MLDKVEYTSEDIDSKLETILGKDNLDEKDISKIKSLIVELWEEKYGVIPLINFKD